MINRFIDALQDAGLVLNDQELADLSEAQSVLHDEDIADILWLTSHIGLPPEPEDLEEPAADESQNDGSTSAVEVVEIDDSESTLGTESAVAPPPPTVSATVPNAAGAEDIPNIDIPETGLPLQVQTAPALPNSRAMGRALRPLMRKVPSRTRQVLDELATVDRIAKEDVWIPVLKPEPERWFELDLVIESSPFSFVWESTLSEFHQVLEQEGAFRSVRTWWVEDAAAGTPKLISKTIPKGVERSSAFAFSGDAISRSPRELIDASGRALVLYVSDCRSPLWQQGHIHEWLKLWSQHQPTTLVQLLPERLWTETELNTGFKIQTSAFTPGVANTDLQVHNPPARRGLTTANTLTLPVVTLTASSMLQWARVVTAAGQQRLPARLFDMNWVRSDTRKQETNWDAIEPETPEALIELFNATASDPAKRLARLMSVVPVELPVVHLLQRTFFGEDADPVHVAEVFDSCLMQPVGKPRPGEALRYDFVPGVRDLLNPVNPIDETLDVLDTLSKEIARTLGFEIRSFTALLYPNADWDEKEKAAILPFAQIATEVLHRLGGQYADLAQQVERDAREQELQTQIEDVEAEKEPAEPTFPELRTIEFLKAELIDEADGPAVEDSPAPRRINEAGLELIKSFEGRQLNARPDAVGEWTIGHGHTSAMGPPEVVQGMRITPAEAEAILREDLRPFEQAVESALTIETTDDQFAALVSFAFNVGIESFASSTLLRKHNAGDFAGAADEFLRWTIAGGQEPPGLVRRREAERDLYLSKLETEISEPSTTLLTDEFTIATIAISQEGEGIDEIPPYAGTTFNPYSPGNPVSGNLFIGREDILNYIDEFWLSSNNNEAILLYGYRRIGKTSILKNLSSRLNSEKVLIFCLDLQSMSWISSDGDFLHVLATHIYDCVPKSIKQNIQKPIESNFLGSASNPYREFSRFLQRIETCRDSHLLIIALDEYEAIEIAIKEERIDVSLIEYFRNLIRTVHWLKIIMAGLYTLQEMEINCWQPLYGVVRPMKVSFLSPVEARSLITEPVRNLPVRYAQEAVDEIINLTGGHPYLIQLVCHCLFSDWSTRTGASRKLKGIIDLNDLDRLTYSDVFLNQGEHYFRNLLYQIEHDTNLETIQVLQAICSGERTIEGIREMTNFSLGSIQETLDFLESHDILGQDNSRNFLFTIELLRLWVSRELGNSDSLQ
jgi:GH24 family phage-related lysozyme (muramidase)